MIPIAIMSYNRPDYLLQVLDSLKTQQNVNIESRKVALFQDGWLHPSLREPRIDPAISAQCINIFRNTFPEGEVFGGEINLGTGLNIDRAERFVFETCEAPAGIFLEDDLVLGPVYLQVLEKLISRALEDERIGYVAAFGNYNLTADQQTPLARKLRPLHLLWGFGLTRSHWLKCRPFIEKYLQLIRGVDYRNRPHEAIRALTASWGVQPGDTAQDRIKSFVTALVGAVKLNTETAYGKYIGERGENFDSSLFEKWGFSHSHSYFTEVQTEDWDFASVDYDPWSPKNNVWRLAPGSETEIVCDIVCDIDFMRGGNAPSFIGAGWSKQEPSFTWTEDDESIVNLPALSEPGKYAIRISSGAFLRKPLLNSQLVKLFLNDKLIWSQSISEAGAQLLEAKFDAEPFVGNDLKLRIQHPDAARPSETSEGNIDKRRLALSVRRLTLVKFLEDSGRVI